jgi:hypothetical protein
MDVKVTGLLFIPLSWLLAHLPLADAVLAASTPHDAFSFRTVNTDICFLRSYSSIFSMATAVLISLKTHELSLDHS